MLKTKTLAASILLALLLSGAGAAAFAHSGLSMSNFGIGAGQNSHSNASSHHSGDSTGDNETEDQNDQGNQTSALHLEEGDNETETGQAGLNLTAGTTLTFSNLTGHYVSFVHMGNESEDDSEGTTMAGNSTGSFTFKVTGVSSDGFNLTIVSGSFSANGTTYTVTSGNLTLNEGGESGSGQGSASGGATFDIHISGIHGNTTSAALVGAIRLDVKVGSGEYLVILGSGPEVQDQSED